MTRERIVVAMSGGVDSSVAAALLAREGLDVVGVTLRLLPRLESGFGCCGSPKDIEDAKRVCDALGVPHYVLSPIDLFEKKVISPFVRAYQEGRTPAPCSECNKSVKFPYLLGLAEACGGAWLATGHYARTDQAGGRTRLLKAEDHGQDQSYFLHGLSQADLSRSRFPLGTRTKAEVRQVARELGLATADKPDSQDLCFIPQGDYRAMLGERLAADAPGMRPGPIRDTSGRVRGAHSGSSRFTVGQRKGLGVSAPEPLFVVAVEPATDTVIVGSEEELLCRECVVDAPNWIGGAPAGPLRAAVRIRHRHKEAPAEVIPEGAKARVRFAEPQRAVTPGQSAVFYAGEEVLGGGPVESVA